MKILITGGLGHIGSHLIRYLPVEMDLVVVDDLSSQRYCSLFNLGRKIKFLDRDIEDLTPNEMKGVDVVIHLAAITNAANSFNNKEELERVNIHKTKKFIKLCRDCNIPRLMFPSSTSVYGVAAEIVYEDDPSVVNPQSPYAESKIVIENVIREKLGNRTKYLILRFGTIFGASAGMRFHTAINKFCYEASMKKPLTIWKQNYKHVRPYLGINDAMLGITHFLRADNELWNNTYNVLTGNYSLESIVDDIKAAIDVELNMVDSPLVNQYSYVVSDDKIRETGYVTSDDLQLEIRKTLTVLEGIS